MKGFHSESLRALRVSVKTCRRLVDVSHGSKCTSEPDVLEARIESILSGSPEAKPMSTFMLAMGKSRDEGLDNGGAWIRLRKTSNPTRESGNNLLQDNQGNSVSCLWTVQAPNVPAKDYAPDRTGADANRYPASDIEGVFEYYRNEASYAGGNSRLLPFMIRTGKDA